MTPCFFCGGAAHPANGCQYTANVVACGVCTRSAWAWIRQHTASKGRRRGPNFYDHVNVVSQPIFVEPEQA